MKAAAIDCSSDYLHVAVCNGDMSYASSCNRGLQHSANIIPALESALTEVDLGPRDIEFIACPEGPGSFTGLRLAFAAAKAVQMAADIPLVTVPTLDIWAEPFRFWSGLVLSAIDGKKKQFYVSAYRGGEKVPCGDSFILDVTPDKLLPFIDPEERILITGPDAALLKEKLEELLPGTELLCTDASASLNCASVLLAMAATKIATNPNAGITDYAGPLYIRKSEAEESLNKST